jgi:hypothetical protein
MIAMVIHQRDDLAFPQSLPEFQRQFPDDAACAAYLMQCERASLSTPAAGAACVIV